MNLPSLKAKHSPSRSLSPTTNTRYLLMGDTSRTINTVFSVEGMVELNSVAFQNPAPYLPPQPAFPGYVQPQVGFQPQYAAPPGSAPYLPPQPAFPGYVQPQVGFQPQYAAPPGSAPYLPPQPAFPGYVQPQVGFQPQYAAPPGSAPYLPPQPAFPGYVQPQVGFQPQYAAPPGSAFPAYPSAPAYTVPYKSVINGGLHAGKNIVIHGVVNHNAQRIAFNLRYRSGIAFHYNPRFDENVVVRNTNQMERWGSEERSGGMPFQRGQPFQVTISCNPHHYNVFVNGKQVHTYKHRYTNLSDIDILEVSGDLQLTLVQA